MIKVHRVPGTELAQFTRDHVILDKIEWVDVEDVSHYKLFQEKDLVLGEDGVIKKVMKKTFDKAKLPPTTWEKLAAKDDESRDHVRMALKLAKEFGYVIKDSLLKRYNVDAVTHECTFTKKGGQWMWNVNCKLATQFRV